MRPYAPKLEIPEKEASATSSIENKDKKEGDNIYIYILT